MAATTPKTSILTKLWFSTNIYITPTQVVYAQEIPQVESAAETITYNSLEFVSERQEQGSKTASEIVIPILFTQAQHTTLKALSDAKTEMTWFLQYPEATATTAGDPLVKYFTGSCNLVGDTIAIGDMLQDQLTLYRNSDVTESAGFPGSISL